MVGEADNVGAISVDVGLNLEPFKTGMKAVEDALTELSQREANVPLNIPKLSDAEVKRWQALAAAITKLQPGSTISGGPTAPTGGGSAAMSHVAFSDQDATAFGTKVAAAVEHALQNLTINVQIGNLDDIKRELGSVQIDEIKVGKVVSQGGAPIHMATAQAVPGNVQDQSRSLILSNIRSQLEKANIGGDLHAVVENLNTQLKSTNQRLIRVFDDAAEQFAELYEHFGVTTQQELAKVKRGTRPPPLPSGVPQKATPSTIESGALHAVVTGNRALERDVIGLMNKTSGLAGQIALLPKQSAAPHAAPVRVVENAAPAAAVPTAERQKAAVINRQEQEPAREPGNNAVNVAARPGRTLDQLIDRALRLGDKPVRATQQTAGFMFDESGERVEISRRAAGKGGSRTQARERRGRGGHTITHDDPTNRREATETQIWGALLEGETPKQRQDREKRAAMYAKAQGTRDSLLASPNISMGGRTPFLYGKIIDQGKDYSGLAGPLLRGEFANQAVGPDGNYYDIPVDPMTGKAIRVPKTGGSLPGREGVFKPVSESQIVYKALRRMGMSPERANVATGPGGIFTAIGQARKSNALRNPEANRAGFGGDPGVVTRAANDLVRGQQIVKRLEMRLAEAEGRVSMVEESSVYGQRDKRGRFIKAQPGRLYFTSKELQQEELDQAKHQRQMAYERLQQGQSQFSRGQLRYVAESVGGRLNQQRIQASSPSGSNIQPGEKTDASGERLTLLPEDREYIRRGQEASALYPDIADSSKWLNEIYDEIIGASTYEDEDTLLGRVTAKGKKSGSLPTENAYDKMIRERTAENLAANPNEKYPVPVIWAMPDENGKLVQRQLTLEEYEQHKKTTPQFTARAALRQRLHGTVESLYDAAGLVGRERTLRKLDDMGFSEIPTAVKALFGHQKNYTEFDAAARQSQQAHDTRVAGLTSTPAGTRQNPRNRVVGGSDVRTDIPTELLNERDRLIRERDELEQKYGIKRIQAGINVNKGGVAGTYETLDTPAYARRTPEEIQGRLSYMLAAIPGAGNVSSGRPTEGITPDNQTLEEWITDPLKVGSSRTRGRNRTQAQVDAERQAAIEGAEKLAARAATPAGVYEKLSPIGEGTGKYITGETRAKHERELARARAKVVDVEKRIAENTRTYRTTTGLVPGALIPVEGPTPEGQQLPGIQQMIDKGAGNLTTGDQARAGGILQPIGEVPPPTPAENLGSRAARTAALQGFREQALAEENEGVGGGGGGGGRPTTEGMMGEGPIHVIVDDILASQVSFGGGGGGGGGPDVPEGGFNASLRNVRLNMAAVRPGKAGTTGQVSGQLGMFEDPEMSVGRKEGRVLNMMRQAAEEGWTKKQILETFSSDPKFDKGMIDKGLDNLAKEGFFTGEVAGGGGGGGKGKSGSTPAAPKPPRRAQKGTVYVNPEGVGAPGFYPLENFADSNLLQRQIDDTSRAQAESRAARARRARDMRDQLRANRETHSGRSRYGASPMGWFGLNYAPETNPALLLPAETQTGMAQRAAAKEAEEARRASERTTKRLEREQERAGRGTAGIGRIGRGIPGAQVGDAGDLQAAELAAFMRRRMGQLGQRAFGPTVVSTVQNALAGLSMFNKPRILELPTTPIAAPPGYQGPQLQSLADLLGQRDEEGNLVSNTFQMPGDPFSRINLARTEEAQARSLYGRQKSQAQRVGEIARRRDEQGGVLAGLQARNAPAGEIEAATKKLGEYNKELDAGKEVLHGLTKATLEQTAGAQFLAENAAGVSDVLGNLAQGFVGGMAAGLVAPLAASAGLAAIGLVKQVFGPAYEAAIGYQNVTNKVIGSLSDQIAATHQAARQTVALTAAQAGLSAATYKVIGPGLEQAATIEAGNKVFGDWISLIRTGENVGGGGMPRGIFQNTGGFNLLGLQTPLGGTPSTLENFIGGFNGVNRWRGTNPIPFRHNDIPGALLDVLGDFANTSVNLDPFGGQFGTFKYGGQPVGGMLPPERNPLAINRINEYNQQMDRMPSGFQFDLIDPAASKENADAIDSMVKAMQNAKVDESVINEWKALHVVIRDSKGDLVTDLPAIAKAWEEFASSFTQMDWAQQLTSLTGPRGALTLQIDQMRRQTELSRQSNRSNMFIQELGTPTTPYGRAVSQVPGLSGAYAGAYAQYAPYANYARSITAGLQVRGMSDTMDFLNQPGLSQDQRQQGMADLGQLNTLGQQYDDLIEKQQKITMGQMWRNYNHDLSIATRQLGDIVGLAGEASVNVPGVGQVGASRVGTLQRDNFEISRDLQLLGFKQQQRSLNYQTALAGFTAEGSTGEERAARSEVAERKAKADQKALDLTEKQAANQYEIDTTMFQRNVDDASFGLENMVKTFSENGELGAISDAMEKNRAATAGVTADLGLLRDEGVAYKSLIIDTGEQMKALGADIDELGVNFENLSKMIEEQTGIDVPNNNDMPAINPDTGAPYLNEGETFGPPAPGAGTPQVTPTGFNTNWPTKAGGGPGLTDPYLTVTPMGQKEGPTVQIVNPSAGVDTQSLVRVVITELNRQAGLRGLTTVGGK